MAFSKEYIVKELQSDVYDCLMIYDASEKKQIAYWEGSSNDLIEHLEQFYAGCEGGRFKVILHNTKNKGNVARAYDAQKKIIPISINFENDYSRNDIRSEDYREKYFELKMQYQADQIRNEFAEKDSGVYDLLMKMFIELQKKRPPGQVMAAPVSAPVNNSGNDNQEILSVLNDWQNADPDFFDNMQKLVELAKNNPAMYAAAKDQLKKL